MTKWLTILYNQNNLQLEFDGVLYSSNYKIELDKWYSLAFTMARFINSNSTSDDYYNFNLIVNGTTAIASDVDVTTPYDNFVLRVGCHLT